MKKIMLAVLLAAGAATVNAAENANDPKMAVAIELLELMDVDQMAKAMEGQLETMIGTQIEPVAECESMQPTIQEYSREMSALFTKGLDLEAFLPQVAQIYVDVFTQEELEAVLAFYRTPVGAKMLAKTPELMQRSTSILQTKVMELMPQIEAAGREFGEKMEAARAECEDVGG